MENNKQLYLNQLIEWGDKTKELLGNLNVSESEISEWTVQIDNWQTDIQNNLDYDETITDRNIELLQNKGQRIFQDIKKQGNKKQKSQYIPFGQHHLPPLPYEYNALEPYISEQIMRLHHDEHHQSYVDGLNKAEQALYLDEPAEDLIKHWLRNQAFHGSGHNLHTIFWFNMTPDSNKKPIGEIEKRIEEDFGSWNNFKELFSKVAASVEGDGWAVLLWNPRSGRLAVQSFEKHQLFQIADSIPLLVLDVWEHAYYLQYQTDKKAYIDNWWNVVNWNDVNKRYLESKNVKWPLY
ncbi:superoxide dismutase [Virgibacillus ainsalahensis]